MKYIAAFALAVGFSCAAALAARAADPGYYDPICPSAGAAVQTYVSLVKVDTTLVADAVAAANTASAAYDRCADRYRSAGDAEHLHYASVCSAQYHFAAGHLMRLDGHFDEARIAFKAALALVADTIVWGTSAAPSAYRAAAVEVRDATQSEIDKMPTAASPAP